MRRQGRRPSRGNATEAVSRWLLQIYGTIPDFKMCTDGDDKSAQGKCGWAFWIIEDDSTSYVHEDLSIEWHGSAFDPDKAQT